MRKATLVALGLCSALAHADPYAFELIIIHDNDPHSQGDDVVLAGLNNAGQVVGYVDLPTGPRERGFVWSEDNGFQFIGSPDSPSQSVRPQGIDDAGIISATASLDLSQYSFLVARAHTFDTGTGTWTQHHPWPGCSSVMQDTSSTGWFCGELADLDQNGNCGSLFFQAEGFVGNASGLERVGKLSQYPSFAHDVNADGDVVGEASLADGLTTRAYIKLQGQSITELPSLGGTFTFAYGINTDHTVVGEGYLAGDEFSVATKWTFSEPFWQIKNLDPGDLYSSAADINNLGNIVGWYYNASLDDALACIWVDDEPFDLNTLVVNPIPNTQLRRATAISDTNWIIGEGRQNGQRVQFILKPVDQDSDADGLLDSWETDGIDVDRDGTIDLVLPEGVDPMRKDVLVEVDVMTNAPFFPEALDDVATAFANAPVDNPDGSTGITAHFIVSDTDLPYDELWDANFINFNAITPSYLGDASERMDPNWPNIMKARGKAYRYCAVANSMNTILGIAEFEGDQFVVALGGSSSPPTRRLFAATFMHELGHCLGLDHGGHDRINYKPNYISCMNYNFDKLTLDNGEPLPLDYSRDELDALLEFDLDETSGFSGGIFYSTTLVFFGTSDGMGGRQMSWVQLDVENFDWNSDGVQEDGAVADLNWLPNSYPGAYATPSPGDILEGSNDWQRIRLPIGQTGPFAEFQAVPPPFEEQTVAERDWLEANLPPPPVSSPCPGDIADDFGIPGADGMVSFGDFLALLGLVGPCGAGTANIDCTGDIADDFGTLSPMGGPDSEVSFGDFLALLGLVGPCP